MGKDEPTNSAVDSTEFNLFEKREKIFTRKIEGFYQNIRFFTGWPLLVGYFICPWLIVSGHQAILFDIPERKFHVFWLTFWPQDLAFLGWALIIAAFILFFVTTLLGRVWCGYTCPQTVWTAIYMWAEQVSEGERHQRIKLDQSPWNWNKIWRRSFKHGMWVGFALLTSVTFVGYFYGIRGLVVDVYSLQLDYVTLFWITFFTLTTYGNAGWLREQVCIYMCPYARFQGAMFDKDTFIVTYNDKRGESRGSRKKGVDPRSIQLGDCIDCNVCVQVCPTGIDIREGLQYQCINCANCIDGCDSIMEKMGYETGLITYSTLNKLEGKEWTWKRTKLIGYGAALCLMIFMFSYMFISRIPVEVDVIRDRGQLYQEVAGGRIQNSYRLKVLNMDTRKHDFQMKILGLPGANIVPDHGIEIEAGEIGEIPVRILIDSEKLTQANTRIFFEVQTLDGLRAESESRFIGPGPMRKN